MVFNYNVTNKSMLLKRDTHGNNYNYEDVIKNFKWDIPSTYNFSKDVIDKFAQTQG